MTAKAIMKTGILLGFLAMASGCRETPPFIDLGSSTKARDSTFINATMPPAQHKAVLIEDITGVQCPNCPKAAQKLKDIISAKTEDSIVAITIYPWPRAGSNPLFNYTQPYPGFPVLANDTASFLVESLDAPSYLPAGYIDRKVFPLLSYKYHNYTEWASLANQRLLLKTPVNIMLEKTVTGSKVSLKISLVYTLAVPGNHKLAVYLTEDGIVSKQKSGAVDIDNFVHNHVLRSTLDLPLGKPLNATLEPGRTFIRQYEYKVPDQFKIANCHIVCVVLDAATEEVINVREIALK